MPSDLFKSRNNDAFLCRVNEILAFLQSQKWNGYVGWKKKTLIAIGVEMSEKKEAGGLPSYPSSDTTESATTARDIVQ